MGLWLPVGDVIKVDNAKYEPVYAFSHRSESIRREYLELGLAGGRSLEISDSHMVCVPGNKFVPASTIQVGDELVDGNGSSTKVLSVKKIVRQGAYAPFTPAGTLVVNGVRASSFIALQDSETLKIAGIDTGLTFQFLAHTFERPHRLWCLHLSNCEEVQYTTEGISLWVDVPHKVARWFLDQNSVVMVVVALPLLGLFAVLANPAAACLSSLLAVLVAARLAVRVKAV